MPFSEDFLKSTPLPEEVLAAFQTLEEENAALLTQRDALTQERDALLTAREAAEQSANLAARRQAFADALTTAGANPAVIALLAERMTDADADIDGAVDAAKEEFAALFAQPVRVGFRRAVPPMEERGPLTRGEIASMSEREVLTRWEEVKSALQKGPKAY